MTSSPAVTRLKDEPGSFAEHRFRLVDHQVRTFVGRGLLDRVPQLLAELDADRYVVVTDDNVRGIAAERLARLLDEAALTTVLSQPPGETHKSLATLSRHIEAALEFGVTRRSVVVAVGGGIPGNTAGLLAGLLFRGVRLVHVPTTTIGACDSVISAKQAVNTSQAKNTVGLYHKPEIIAVDLDVLAGGPPRDLRSGVCETIKNSLALDPSQIPVLRGLLRPQSDYSPDELATIFDLSLDVKSRLLERDPYEKMLGVVLEYGHTIGHALELAGASLDKPVGPLRHGEGVALGMLAASALANRMGLLDDDTVAVHEELVAQAGVCRCLVKDVSPHAVLRHVEFDNKRGYQRHGGTDVPMVLLEGLGVPHNAAERYLTPVPRSEVADAVHDLLRRGRDCVGSCAV